MDAKTAEDLSELLEKWENSTLSETLRILNMLAKAGLVAHGVEKTATIEHDPCYGPDEAARYLGVSVRTLRDSLTRRYEIQSTGTGKGRLYRLSELNRVRDQREMDVENG